MSAQPTKILNFETPYQELKRLTENFHTADSDQRGVMAERMATLVTKVHGKDDTTGIRGYAELLICRPFI